MSMNLSLSFSRSGSPIAVPCPPAKAPTFHVADTRKCTKVITRAGKNASSKNNQMFTPPTKPLPSVFEEAEDRGLKQVQGLLDFESWHVDEDEEDQGNPLQHLFGFSLPSQPPLGFGSVREDFDSLNISSTDASTCGVSTSDNAVTDARFKVARFREDLDEHEQRDTIRAYRKERDELWVTKMQLEGSSVIKHTTKRQQALSLALLVAEAHIFKRSGKKATMSTDHLPAPPAAAAVATTANPAFKVEDPRVAAMLLYDIFLLVDNHQEGEDRYDSVRTQLISLTLWR